MPIEIEFPSGTEVRRSRIRNDRKRRTRPSTERFQDLYEATGVILGRGSQGTVHCYTHRQTRQEYAVKTIYKTVEHNRSKILKEIELFHHCQGHPNIVQLVEYYEEAEAFYLVFERLTGGSLFEHVQMRGHLSESEASQIIHNLADALNFLHCKGIAHRDLKPENILCANAETLTPVKICDFDLGSAIIMQQETNTPVTTPELMTPVGSAEYMAPEVVDAWVGDSSSYDKKCDIWSLGIILYIMLCGYPPFYAKCGEDCGWSQGDTCQACQDMLFERIQDGTFDFPEREWAHISEDAKSLICHLLVRQPRFRYSAKQVLDHAWIRDPAPQTSLQTPRVLSRSSSQLLDSYAENAMAFNRMMIAQLARSSSLSSCSSTQSADGNFPQRSQSPAFFVGDCDDSDYESWDSEDSVGVQCHLEKSSTDCDIGVLSSPSSKLALRRKSRQLYIPRN